MEEEGGSTMGSNPVVHFEMPYEDSKRVAQFYAETFGWRMDDSGEEMGNYIVAITTDTDANGRPSAAGTINGGFFQRKPDWPAQHPSVVIAVDDIEAAMSKIEGAGGTVLGEAMEIPGVGKYVSFTDSEQNRVSLLQPQDRKPQ
jgi:predicted enzyme related to lactoylglutathione lyase